ncbi:hypothetical protein L873DRAFT_1770173 [Choiromyces venosus 120613-1]|uniref:Ankyrin n=1 Tax=Choiromyces venosus 120613-1 TaxID=1336337 RepID=A0A3N4JIY4_9PEZI|nr:hypothetical protein L873DRAFT_1770173 [Choiromyces venosus 120613-1]
MGHERIGVIKILLDRDDINPDISDDKGEIPLSFALSAGHNTVMWLLQGEKHNSNTVDSCHQVSLFPSLELSEACTVEIKPMCDDLTPVSADIKPPSTELLTPPQPCST